MTEDIKVSMFGSSCAMLLNQLAESTGNQEGFLLGSLVSRQYRMNSDSSSNLDKQWTQVHLSTMLPLHGQSVFQPSGVAWKHEACEELLKSCHPDKQIVGFYQLKKADIITPSLKDRRLMAGARNVFPEPFIYLVIGESVADTRATYKYRSASYIANNKPLPVVIEVLNLGKGEEMKYMSAPRGNSTELSHILVVDNWPEQVKAMETVVDRFEHIHEDVLEQAK